MTPKTMLDACACFWRATTPTTSRRKRCGSMVDLEQYVRHVPSELTRETSTGTPFSTLVPEGHVSRLDDIFHMSGDRGL